MPEAPLLSYSHLFNKRGGWNKRGGSAKVAKSLNLINEECRVEKSKISINVEGGFLFCGGWNFFKSVSVEMRVLSDKKPPLTHSLLKVR